MADRQSLILPDFQSRFDALHIRYEQTMMHVALRILKDHHLAEDAVQEAFLRIARNFSKIGELESPQTRVFVITVVRNVSLKMLARLGRQTFVQGLDPDMIADDNLEDSMLDRMNYDLVLQAIRALPPIYKEALLLYYVDEMNTVEIAQRLKIDVETVKKRIQRGRRMVIDGLTAE